MPGTVEPIPDDLLPDSDHVPAGALMDAVGAAEDMGAASAAEQEHADGTVRVDQAVAGPLTGLGTVAWTVVPDDPVARAGRCTIW
jgi:hypothetical protein